MKAPQRFAITSAFMPVVLESLIALASVSLSGVAVQ